MIIKQELKTEVYSLFLFAMSNKNNKNPDSIMTIYEKNKGIDKKNNQQILQRTSSLYHLLPIPLPFVNCIKKSLIFLKK